MSISKAKKSDEVKKVAESKKFGTFQGVFTPTVLTILGIIMYLRQPWVVGNAGVLGAIAIIMLAVAITLFTALSMSSMTTNIRIGAGGAFSIISQSLGIEMGGAIGIPLYFSQALAVTMYVFGFREGVQWLIEEQTLEPDLAQKWALAIDVFAFALVYIITRISTDFAFKIQYVLMIIVFASILSILGGLWETEIAFNDMQMIGDFGGGENSFWVVFAIFFPAVTGVMAGANMSGDLENPRVNIPRGTLTAVLLTAFIYIGLVFVAAMLATPFDLQNDYNIFIDRSIYPPIVVVGLLGATFSSALSSYVGAPRILMALGQSKVLPKSDVLAKTDKKGEPQNAMLFTGVVVILALLLRNLNAIAPLITMFFMITYAMINVVVLIEQSLGLPSFRPTFKIPIIVPLLGTLGCFFVMFIINPTFSLVSLAIVIAFYWFLLRRDLGTGKGDARSGLFTAMAEWATKKSNEISPTKSARAWQPELLLPVEDPKELRGAYKILYSLTYPKGSIKVLGMKTGGQEERLRSYLPSLMDTFNEAKIAASYTILDGEQFEQVVSISMQALGTAFFKPNTIFLKLKNGEEKQEEAYKLIIREAKENQWGLLMYLPYETGLGIERTINVWFDTIPDDWNEQMDLGNNDLAMLTGLVLRKNWKGKLNIIKTVRSDSEYSKEYVEQKMEEIRAIARFPKDSKIYIIERNPEMWNVAPQADLNIMELPNKDNFDFGRLRKIPENLRTSCIFTVDSGNESALV